MLKTIPQALIIAAQNGDTEAINELLTRCQPDLHHFARKVCATPEDVEDAVQETLWIVSQKIGTLRVISAFTTWLFRVVKHECYRLLRSDPWEVTLAIPLDLCDPAGLEIQAVPMEAIVAAIARLGPIYREVLILRDVESMTAPEVAESLGITVEAVKSRLHRARMSVREELKAWAD